MTAEGIPPLVNVLERFPRLRVILDHLARPVQDAGVPYRVASGLDTLAFLSDRDREWIFSLTAQTLYPSLAGHSR